MRFLILLFFTIAAGHYLSAQNTLKAVIKDGETARPLPGATAVVVGTTLGAAADGNGYVEVPHIPDGPGVIEFSFTGYEPLVDTIVFPLNETLQIMLTPQAEEMEEVTVTATRSSRLIADIPTRVEVIAGEELEEKGNMKPGDIRMLLNESTGIQTQQTSATSYNSSIRIQGLDGKYTQILRDGMPLYAGFSGGLGLLQIAPLDLKQVEVIKGASSTLYGGGAIAGLVNLVSKTPDDEREISFMVNGTSALGLDLSGFYSEKFAKTGTTVFASYNHGTPYDPANIGLTAIPEFNRYTLNPALYLYLGNSTLKVGVNSTLEKRTGGDIDFINGEKPAANAYFEKNNTVRLSSQLAFDHQVNSATRIALKNSVSYYDREISIPAYEFSGLQLASFSEASFSTQLTRAEWIAGINLWTDRFEQNNVPEDMAVDYNYTTAGLFVQNTFNVTEVLTLESGLRGDYQNKFGFFLLPRISAMLNISEKITARIGGGFGYKAPTVFTEDAERIQFRNVLPLNTTALDAEESRGANVDLNYRTPLGDEVTLNLNTLFFYTRIYNPVILTGPVNGFYEYIQPDGSIMTRGIETNIKLTYSDFKLFIGYTLADVNEKRGGDESAFPLVARNRLNNVLMYEVEDKIKIGLEAYYFSKQELNDGTTGRAYWICGLMTEKIWENFSVFLNFENFLDTRQTKFDTIFTGPVSDPGFRDIYAPVDGFVINGGFKVRL